MPATAIALGLPFARLSGNSFAGVLDDYTSNLAVVLSAKSRLLSSYTGPLIRVRADRTGQPEEDISYLANGDIDEAALLAFASSDDVYVTKIYRQDGSSNDAAQSTASLQPLIVTGGVMQDGAYFAGSVSGDCLDIPSAASTEYTDGTHIQVLIDANSNSSNNGRLFEFANNCGFWSEFSGQLYWDSPVVLGRINGSTPVGYLDTYKITSLERDGTDSRIRIDGTAAITGTVSGSVTGTSVLKIGDLLATGSSWKGNLRSFIVWKDCTAPATRAALLT